MRKEFRDLIDPGEFRDLIREFDLGRSKKSAPLDDALGEVVAGDVYARSDVPPFSRSLMDGYAVVASDTYGADEENPNRVEIDGEVEIGRSSSLTVEKGKALEIPTGAAIPAGANAVVMVEDTDREGGELLIRSSVVPGENVLSAGTDIATGDLIIRRGEELTPLRIAELAGSGLDEVEVYRPPEIGIISTGPELVPPGGELPESKIYDVNTSLLLAGVREAGGRATGLGVVNDDLEEMDELIDRGLENYDILLSSGSTSAGPHDMVYDVLEGKGDLLAHGVKIKPGKPTVLADLNGIPFFGLPGNPSSAYVVFNNFVAPFIRKLAGKQQSEATSLSARLTERAASEGGRTEQKFVGIVDRDEGKRAYPINKVSGAVTLLSQADGYVTIPEGVNYLGRDQEVEVTPLTEDPELPGILLIGSNCVGLNRLLELLPIKTRSLVRGSMGGVEAIRNGVADAAGVHIWDEDDYNVPFLKARGIEDVKLLRGYRREQGLILQPGNPKGVGSVEDLIEKEVRIVNRVSGSGTRILFDHLLENSAGKLDRDPQEVKRSIPGYEVELSTHNAVAAAVRDGKAEAGLGIRSVAEAQGLDFVKLQEEEFDFLCRADFLESEEGRTFQERLSGSEFAEILEGISGLQDREEIGQVVFSSLSKDE
ncbi:molybdopterin biosynthesis protein [Candidatus Bipolaricaulota bacterium]|nr:molybdopterin biosynthesis protein [Candidatus Bipolaricaulota bacterium]